MLQQLHLGIILSRVKAEVTRTNMDVTNALFLNFCVSFQMRFLNRFSAPCVQGHWKAVHDG